MTIKAIVGGVVLGMAAWTALSAGIGFVYGVSVTNKSHAQEFMGAAAASQQAANTQAASSAIASASVDKQQAASAHSIQTISAAVSQRVATNEPTIKVVYKEGQCPSKQPAVESDSNGDVAGSPWRLDSGSVRLLNAARLGLSAESSGFGNAERDNEPSTVGLEEFATNDLEVVARYQALKIKHDALVDWVDQLKEQNLGLCVASEHLYQSSMEDP